MHKFTLFLLALFVAACSFAPPMSPGAVPGLTRIELPPVTPTPPMPDPGPDVTPLPPVLSPQPWPPVVSSPSPFVPNPGVLHCSFVNYPWEIFSTFVNTPTYVYVQEVADKDRPIYWAQVTVVGDPYATGVGSAALATWSKPGDWGVKFSDGLRWAYCPVHVVGFLR